MGRSEAKATNQQALAISQQNANNASTALGQTNTAVQNYNKQLQDYLNFGRQTYGRNGEFMRETNAQATEGAAAGARATEGDLALNRLRTKQNTANYAPTVAASRQANTRAVTDQLISANAQRLQNLQNIQQTGLQASQFPAQAYGNIYGTSTGASTSALGPAAQSAQTPGFWDVFAPALAGGAGTAIAGACPCKGSMILMADGNEKPVEEIQEGDFLWSLSTSAPPNPVRKKPIPVMQECMEIRTDLGHAHRASESHTIALAIGGYATMKEAQGQIALVGMGTGEIVEAKPIGRQFVYVMEIGGNHTYRADGIWIIA